jgi:uncharacterized protein
MNTPPNETPNPPSLIEYPSRFPIKVMGLNVGGFVHAITQIAQQFDPGFDASSVELRSNSMSSTARSAPTPW